MNDRANSTAALARSQAATWSSVTQEITAIARAGSSDPGIAGVEYDSRRVTEGSIFVAMRGGTTDGSRYIQAALNQGACGILTDSEPACQHLAQTHPDIPRILVQHGRTALAQAASAFFDHPERKLSSTGVTGTNGKTTTAFLIEALLNAANHSTVLVGTIEYHVAGQIRPSAHTTPESRDLFELMAEEASLGASELVMEVSSHALHQGRVEGVGFDVAVFTNLTRDHLDYHGTMDEYFAAKQQLFDGKRYPAPRVSVLNAGDPYSIQLASSARIAGSLVITYGLNTSVASDWQTDSLQLTPAGAHFKLTSPAGTAQIDSPLAGEVNILNLLAALAAAHARGVSFEDLIASIPKLHPVPGRFQPVNAGQPFTVIVDYAHTDDALRNLTALARQLIPTKVHAHVITLFGCGGDRDRTKRPRMGLAAGQGSDSVIVTSDNPRSEDPEAIIAEILPGLRASGVNFAIEPDRASAIRLALSKARPNDVVLIAGKGHEKQQILHNGPLFFDDAQVALSALRALGYGEGQ